MTTRKIAKDVTALLCAGMTIELANREQYFCETAKCYEVWEKVNGLDRFITRVRKSNVLFVSTDPDFLPSDEWIAEREKLLQEA